MKGKEEKSRRTSRIRRQRPRKKYIQDKSQLHLVCFDAAIRPLAHIYTHTHRQALMGLACPLIPLRHSHKCTHTHTHEERVLHPHRATFFLLFLFLFFSSITQSKKRARRMKQLLLSDVVRLFSWH